jgi:hypothetical protein
LQASNLTSLSVRSHFETVSTPNSDSWSARKFSHAFTILPPKK